MIENLDEDVRKVLKIDPEYTKNMLDDNEFRFMAVTRHILKDAAVFDTDNPRAFDLKASPAEGIPIGRYVLRTDETVDGVVSYRPNTALGEYVLETAKKLDTPYAEIKFDISGYPGKITILEQLKGRSGFLKLERLVLKSLDNAEFLLFSVVDENGQKFLDPDIGSALFKLSQTEEAIPVVPEEIKARLDANAAQYAKATAAEVGEANNEHFKEATDKLIRWSEDQVAAATHRIETLRARQLEVEREIRHAKTLDEQVPLQKELDNVRRDIRRARANVSAVEDETDEKRRRLLDALQRKLVPEVSREEIFTIKWNVI